MKYLLSFIMILMLCFFLTGCAEKECKQDLDCSSGSCFSAVCEDYKCVKTPKIGCCGNLMCEKDKGENVCSCSKDCTSPKCEGKVVVKEKGTKKYYGQYLQYMCKEDKCVMGIDESIVKVIPLLNEKEVNDATLEIGLTFNKPFDLANDKVIISISLKDFEDNKVVLPIIIKSIKIMQGDILYGQMNLDKELSQVGAGIKEMVPLTFVPEEKEKEVTLTLKVDYEMTKLSNEAEQLVRDSFTEQFSQKMFIASTGEANLGEK